MRPGQPKMARLIVVGDKDMQVKLAGRFNKGFTYIGLLLFIVITGIGLSVAGMSWQYQVRAEKEKQLLFVGAEFRSAINSYYISTPEAGKVYPASLNDLLLDKRMPNIKRHLRKIYLDPMTGKADWGVVTQQGRIVGIYSRSTLVPFKKAGFNVLDAKFAGEKSYKGWIFTSNSAKNLKSGEDNSNGQRPKTELAKETSVKTPSVLSQDSVKSNIIENSMDPQNGCGGDCLRFNPDYRP